MCVHLFVIDEFVDLFVVEVNGEIQLKKIFLMHSFVLIEMIEVISDRSQIIVQKFDLCLNLIEMVGLVEKIFLQLFDSKMKIHCLTVLVCCRRRRRCRSMLIVDFIDVPFECLFAKVLMVEELLLFEKLLIEMIDVLLLMLSLFDGDLLLCLEMFLFSGECFQLSLDEKELM